jgi:hypothetical protein
MAMDSMGASGGRLSSTMRRRTSSMACDGITRTVTATAVRAEMSVFSLPDRVSKSADKMVTALHVVRWASRAMLQTCPEDTGPSSGPT